MVDRFPGEGEALLYALVLAFGSLVAVCLLVVLSELDSRFVGLRQRFASNNSRERIGMLMAGIFASVAARLIWHFCTRQAWFTDDESAYVFQAKLYSDGHLSGALLQPEALFEHQFVVEVAPDGGVRQRTGVYPVLQPFLMALSSVFGDMHVSQSLALGVITYNTGRLAQTLFRDPRVGLTAAWLCAVSPCLLGLGATYHTSILATALSVVSLRLLSWAREGSSVLRGLLLGLSTGAIFLTRPLDGAIMVCGVGFALVWRAWSGRGRAPRFFPIIGYALGGMLPLLVYVAVNMRLTGHPLRSAYTLLEEQVGSFFGFGPDKMFGREHSAWLGMIQTLGALIRLNTWLFGWPSCLLLWVASLHSAFRTRTTLALMGLSGVQLLAYAMLAFGSVHDFGTAYHVWHTPWIACVTSHVLCRLVDRIQASGSRSRLSVGRVFVALTLSGALLFWPLQLTRVATVASAIVGPIRVAQEVIGARRALVLWDQYPPPGPRRTWVLLPPVAHPQDNIVWAYYNPSVLPLLRQNFNDRAFFKFSWSSEERPVVVPFPPVADSH